MTDSSHHDIDEEIVPEEELEDPKSQLKSLREKLKAAEVEKKEYLDGWQRARADFMNARKSELEDRERAVRDAKESVLRDMATALDTFYLAMHNKEQWNKVEASWRVGVESIYAQCLKALSRHGMEAFGAPGEQFDPRLHVSVGVEPTEAKDEDDQVREVLRRGYKIGERVIRPAEVKVAHFESKS